ncbi:hypothetical protein OSB04_012726, partial [Centaurea solstitialis]
MTKRIEVRLWCFDRYTESYSNNMTFASIKARNLGGGGHIPTENKPDECFAMFKRFVQFGGQLCLDYILGNLEQKLKIRPSKTKPGHKMRTRGFEPGVNEIRTIHIPHMPYHYATSLV